MSPIWFLSTSRYRLARRREYYRNRRAAMSSDSREAALEDARERCGAASQSEREERLGRRRERDRMRRQNETDEQRQAR